LAPANPLSVALETTKNKSFIWRSSRTSLTISDCHERDNSQVSSKQFSRAGADSQKSGARRVGERRYSTSVIFTKLWSESVAQTCRKAAITTYSPDKTDRFERLGRRPTIHP
jgi:hypothetical protein